MGHNFLDTQYIFVNFQANRISLENVYVCAYFLGLLLRCTGGKNPNIIIIIIKCGINDKSILVFLNTKT